MDKIYQAEDFGFGETFKGEKIMGVQSFNGKILIFTPTNVYVALRLKWYQRAWEWLKARFGR